MTRKVTVLTRVKKSTLTLGVLLYLGAAIWTGCDNSVEDDPPPPAPSVPTVTAGDKQLTITWTPVEAAESYEAYWHTADKTDAIPPANKQDVSSGTSAIIPNLTNGTVYYVWIKAKNAAGTSDFSPPASGKPAVISSEAITWEAIQVDGESKVKDSVSILFKFKADPGELSADDITLTPVGEASNGAVKGDLSGTGTARHLALMMVNTEGNVAVSINKTGIAPGPKNVMLYRQARTEQEGPVTWLVAASGHEETQPVNSQTAGGKSTNCFTFTFSSPVENLQADEINLGITGWNTLSLTPSADKKVWTLEGEIVRDIHTNRWMDLNVSVNHTGVNANPQNTDTKYYISACMGYTLTERGGTAGSVNSAAIDITFAFPLSKPLLADEVTITEDSVTNETGTRIGKATKGAVTPVGTDGKKWSIALTDVESTGPVRVTIQKTGVFTKGAVENAGNAYPNKVTVQSATPDNDFTVEQVGGTAGSISSTALKLTFNRAVESLARADIVVTAVSGSGGGSANLNGDPTSNADKKVWTVPVSVGIEGNIKVKIRNQTAMTVAEKTVTVFKKSGIETLELDSFNVPILLDDYLASLASNTAAAPATARLSSSVRLADDWGLVNQTVNAAAKYVILDLSSCPDTSIAGMDAQDSTPSGNDFNIIRNNQYIKGVILPSGMTEIGNYAFDACDNLTQIGTEANTLHIPARITRVGNNAFRDVNHITTLLFDPRSGAALSIGISAFADSSGSDANGPSTSVTTGFSGALVIPANTTFVKNGSNASRAFEFRKFFTSLIIGEGCTDIPQKAFQWCQGLTEITIPASVDTIRTNAFYKCGGVTKVTILAAPADVNVRKITTFESQSSGTGVNKVRTIYNTTTSGHADEFHFAGVYTGDASAMAWGPLP